MTKRLGDILEKSDGVLLTSPYNMRYFSGFTGDEGAVLITKKDKFLFTDSRYIEQADKETNGFILTEANDWIKSVGEIVEQETLGKLAFEDSALSAGQYKKLDEAVKNCELMFCSGEVNSLRMIKTPDELKKIQQAEALGCKAFEHILGFIKTGVHEKDIALEIEYFMRKHGAEKTSFDTIAISGARTSLPHGAPTDKKIEKGDFVTLDFGCVLDGYCSDMTRTVVVGKATEEQKKIYNTVKIAQQMALDFIRSGIKCCEADEVARDYIASKGYGEYFRHSLGHGVGLLVHEFPNLSPKSEIVLLPNMVVSCEPGIYIPGFGGVRIEDLVCVTQDGCQNLSPVTKELIEL